MPLFLAQNDIFLDFVGHVVLSDRGRVNSAASQDLIPGWAYLTYTETFRGLRTDCYEVDTGAASPPFLRQETVPANATEFGPRLKSLQTACRPLQIGSNRYLPPSVAQQAISPAGLLARTGARPRPMT